MSKGVIIRWDGFVFIYILRIAQRSSGQTVSVENIGDTLGEKPTTSIEQINDAQQKLLEENVVKHRQVSQNLYTESQPVFV